MPPKPNTPGQSGGEQTNDPSYGQSAEPTRPAGLELVDYNAPALKVKITVNPELELTLSRTNEILEVKALNADAEGLLAGMDLVGQPYESGIVSILEEAKEQEYLKDLSKVSVTVEELSDGAWTLITEETLTQPIEDYQQNSGVIFSCRLTPAGESLDIEELTVLETARTEGIFVTVYGDAAGNDKLHIYENDDGTRTEGYFISDTEEIWINYYSDGSYQYSYNEGLVSQGYGEYPDGRRYTFVEYRVLVDGLTQPVWYEKTYSDGSAEEYFYENSEWIRTAFTNADGSTWETFYENGTMVSEVWKNADGSTQETFYENGKPVRDVITTADGLTQETLYENGQPVRMVITTADGSTQEMFYENGQPVLNEGTTADGGTFEQTFYPNGNLKTYTESREGTYVEQHYDENGLMISLFQRDPDGTEYDWDYENGEAVGYTVTYPDGSTQIMSFGDGSAAGTNPDGSTYELTHYPNGNLKTNTTTWPNGDYSKQTYYENGNWETTIEFREGSYTETYYDENGMLTSSFRREPDGTEYEYGYQNGSLKTSIITWSNGDYEHYTYYENGVFATQIGQSDGNYFENHYDENGRITSSFERHSDGAEYDWDYENGEAVGYTVTYPDGSSEYHSYAP